MKNTYGPKAFNIKRVEESYLLRSLEGELLKRKPEFPNDTYIKHTYLVYKKLSGDRNNPFHAEKEEAISSKILQLIKDNISTGVVTHRFELETDGYESMVFCVRDKKHIWFFVSDYYAFILTNYFPLGNKFGLSFDELCIAEEKLPSDRRTRFVHQFMSGDDMYKAINTPDWFGDFNPEFRVHSSNATSEHNLTYWSDFEQYFQKKPCLGRHYYVRVRDILVAHKFSKSDDPHFKSAMNIDLSGLDF